MLTSSLALANVSCGVGVRSPASDTVVHQTPITLSGYSLVFVSARIDGQEVQALVDTGSASAVRLSARLAHRLQLALTTVPAATMRGLDGQAYAIQRGRVGSLQIAGIQDKDVVIEVTGERIEAISSQVGTPFDVVLGWGFLARDDFLLDYQRRVLQLGPPIHPVPPRTDALNAIPYLATHRLPIIAARIGERDVRLLVDTGAPMCNLDAAFTGLPAGQSVNRVLHLGAQPLQVQWRVKDLTVTQRALGTIGTLGNNLLSRYSVGFRVREQTMILG